MMPFHAARRAARFLLLATLCACVNTWQARPGVLAGPLGPRERARLWVRGQGHELHGIRVVGDSVVAVPFFRPPSCDSCALRFALRDVDSVQVLVADQRATITAAVLATVLLVPLLYYLSQLRGMAD